ncbi:MAG: type VI secretion system baseplate subunit TssG [Calditrichales bacterium]|nr:MAG: type VI secretion system baseplate subunit TssG [Calditrichales bacterium]
MATGLGKNFTGLIADLEKHFGEYSVFYAIFLCEMLLDQKNPQRDSEKFDQAGISFRPFEDYIYPPSDIRDFSFNNDQMKFVLNFLGLYGINSPLPRCYHEQVAIQQEVHGSGDIPLQNFLDIFNDRFYWLYYQGWKKYRYYLQLSMNPANATMQRLFAFIGLPPGSDWSRLNLPPFKLMQLSGVLSNRVRNKKSLVIFLNSFFPSLKIEIQEFVPTMVPLSDLPQLGSKRNQAKLGKNSVIGCSIRDCSRRIALTIGPIAFADYLEFCSGGSQLNLLNQLMRLYLNDFLEYDLNFVIYTGDIPDFICGDPQLKLGRNIWLGKPERETVRIKTPFERIRQTSI